MILMQQGSSHMAGSEVEETGGLFCDALSFVCHLY